jgi:hypothetical protein
VVAEFEAKEAAAAEKEAADKARLAANRPRAHLQRRAKQ